MKINAMLFCLLFALTANSFTTAKAQVKTTDSLALVDLYNSTNGLHWKKNTNWLTANPVSTWYGIKVAGSRVVNVTLRENKLNGALPASIGNLTNLTYLNLYTNQLSGAIPVQISNLTNLTYLDLFANQLSGAIPAEIGNLTNLTYLGLGNNKLTGTIPFSIGNLTNLTELRLDENSLTGTIPAEIGNLIKLTSLLLETNQLTGTIPAAIGNLKKMNFLVLSNNQLSGSIPDFLSSLKKLKQLDLSYNQLSGAVPSTLSNLANLGFLFLNNNQLSGAIPASLNKIKNLNSSFSYNKFTQFSNFNASKDTNYYTESSVDHNLLTFDQLQPAAKYFYAYYYYAPQDTILPIHQHGNTLAVSAGGTLGKNTYTWYQAGTAGKTVIKKDSTFSPAQSGMYFAQVRNSALFGLVLYTDTVSYTIASQSNATFLTENTAQIKIADSKFSVYPNPAKDIVHVQINGTAMIVLTNSAGKIIFSKSINNDSEINVSSYANGIYYIQNKTTGETQKVIVVH